MHDLFLCIERTKKKQIKIILLVVMYVMQWLGKHPDFVSNPFYVCGNSYSGKVVPAIVQEISEGIFCF